MRVGFLSLLVFFFSVSDRANATSFVAQCESQEISHSLRKTYSSLLHFANADTCAEAYAELSKRKTLEISRYTIEDFSPFGFLEQLEVLILMTGNLAEQPTSLAPLKKLKRLKKLHFFYLSKLSEDFSPLLEMPSLRELLIADSQWTQRKLDVKTLARLTQLTTLKIWTPALREVNFVSKLKNLRVLGLAWKRDMLTPIHGDISVLKELPQLEVLGLGVSGDLDLSPVEHLPNLVSLDVSIDGQLKNVDTIAKLRELRRFRLVGKGARVLSDLSILSALKNLQTLDLYAPEVTSLEGLKSLEKMKTLVLYGAKSLRNAEAISGLKLLETLEIPGGQLTDLQFLKGTPQLKKLNLNYNPLSDVSSLKYVKLLETLKLEAAQLKDISQTLLTLKQLRKLELSRNPLTDLPVLSSLKFLKELRILDVPISPERVAAIQEASPTLNITYSYKP